MKRNLIDTFSVVHTNKNNGKTILRFFNGEEQVQYHSNKVLFTIAQRELTWRIQSIPANDIYLLEIKSPSTIQTFRKLSPMEIESIQELFPNPVGEKNKY